MGNMTGGGNSTLMAETENIYLPQVKLDMTVKCSSETLKFIYTPFVEL